MAPGWGLNQNILYITDINRFIFWQEMYFKEKTRRVSPIFRRNHDISEKLVSSSPGK
jgi:hypothetical protein